MKIIFHILGIPISFLGLTTAIGMIVGIYVAKKEAIRKGLKVDKLMDIALYSMISGIIGARLFYIIFYNPSFYFENPIEIFKINEGGMSIHGGIFAAILVSFLYIKNNKLNFFRYADAVAPAIILGQAIGRVGCDVFGKAMTSSLPWGIVYQGELVHPVQVYEFILNYLGFFILWRNRKNIKYDGQLFLWYVILFAVNRGLVEFFRVNPSIFGWLSISHLLSIIFITVSILTIHILKKKSNISLVDDIIVKKESKYELLMEILFLILLIIISIIIFYSVQTT